MQYPYKPYVDTENEDVKAAVESAVEKLFPEYMQGMIADAQLWGICSAIINEHCLKNGYSIYKTRGYGWQTESWHLPFDGRKKEKLELFATYPDALRYVLNRINEDIHANSD